MNSSSVLAYGEPENGFPSWEERMVQVMTNRSRSDPQADLADCSGCAEKACYTPVPPTMYDYNLNRSARFHCANLSACSCGLQHNSPCTLVSDISTLYDPGPCDGSASCACEGGTCDCGGGTEWNARISMFGTSPSAENAAGDPGDPKSVFYMWLWEGDSDTSCGWRMSNGHRANILGGGNGRLGVGQSSGYYVQDFSGGSPDHKIAAGAHYPNNAPGEVEFMANWYDTTGPGFASVNIDGTCHAMALERGSDANGSYLYGGTVGGTCPRYYFIFKDASGAQVTYPDTGSFGIGSGCEDWTEDRPAAGEGCDCAPSCGGKICGDNGCGGSCGDCDPGYQCSAAGQCVQLPADETPDPVSDADVTGPDATSDPSGEEGEESGSGCGCVLA